MKEYDARTGKPKQSKKSKGNVAPDDDQIDLAKVRVYFPSRDTVLQSQGGKSVSCDGGTLNSDYIRLQAL